MRYQRLPNPHPSVEATPNDAELASELCQEEPPESRGLQEEPSLYSCRTNDAKLRRLDDIVNPFQSIVTMLRPGRPRFGRVDELVILALRETRRRILIHDHDRVPVQLQGAGGHHARHRALDRLRNRFRFGVAAGHEYELARIEDRANAHGDGIDRHVLSALEEARVVVDGLLGKRLEPRA